LEFILKFYFYWFRKKATVIKKNKKVWDNLLSTRTYTLYLYGRVRKEIGDERERGRSREIGFITQSHKHESID
jgi:hypothetical protein